MPRSLLLFLVVHVAASLASPFIVDTAHGTLFLEGRQEGGADAHITGSFRSSEGDGIRFRSTPDSLEVTTMDGQNLVNVFRHPAVVQTNGEEAKTTVYQFLDDTYAEASSQIYRATENIAAANAFAPPQFPANMQDSELNDPQAAIQESLDRLAAHPAVRLLEPAARALGEELEIIGKEEPAAMAFYTAAMTLTEAYNKNRRAAVALARNANPFDAYINRPVNVQDYRYWDKRRCPPCPRDECFGLCGYGCNCWRFLCGDCCFHVGCADHDVCCRRNFYTAKCVFPVRSGFVVKRDTAAEDMRCNSLMNMNYTYPDS